MAAPSAANHQEPRFTRASAKKPYRHSCGCSSYCCSWRLHEESPVCVFGSCAHTRGQGMDGPTRVFPEFFVQLPALAFHDISLDLLGRRLSVPLTSGCVGSKAKSSETAARYSSGMNTPADCCKTRGNQSQSNCAQRYGCLLWLSPRIARATLACLVYCLEKEHRTDDKLPIREQRSDCTRSLLLGDLLRTCPHVSFRLAVPFSMPTQAISILGPRPREHSLPFEPCALVSPDIDNTSPQCETLVARVCCRPAPDACEPESHVGGRGWNVGRAAERVAFGTQHAPSQKLAHDVAIGDG